MKLERDGNQPYEVGLTLRNKFPDVQPYSLTLREVGEYMRKLSESDLAEQDLTEPLLEAIQLKWNEHWEDSKGF